MNGGETLKKTWIIFLIGCLLVAAVAYAAITASMNVPQTANVGELIEVSIDKVVWSDETTLDWGTIYQGSKNYKELNVTNTSDLTITVFLYFDSLPAEWFFNWPGNETELAPTEQIVSNLNLTLPPIVSSGVYNWNSIITVEEV